MSKLINV